MVSFFHVKKVLFKLFLPWIILSFKVIFEFHILISLINFLTEILKNLGFRLTVHIEFAKNCAVFGFFYLIAVERWLFAFLCCQGDSLFFFKHTLYFFVIKVSQPVKVLAENSEYRLLEDFGDVSMKFIIFREHLYFTRELTCRIFPFEQFLIIIVTQLFSEFASLWSDFLLHEIINIVSVVKVNIGQIAVIQCAIEHDREVFSSA